MSRTLLDVLNESNPNKLPNAANILRLGSALSVGLRYRQRFTSATPIATIDLPDGMKCAVILTAYARAGATTGALTPVIGAPATTEIGLDADGNLLLEVGTDDITDVEVDYLGVGADVIEETVQVVADIATPLFGKSAMLLLEAEALTGGAVGDELVVLRGTTPGAGEAAITDTGTVEFAAADAVTSARIKYVAFPGIGTAAEDFSVRLADTVAV